MNSARWLLLQKARTLLPHAPVPSPCVSVCRMDAGRGLCTGCFRTLEEIAAWGSLDEARKREVWAALQDRAAAQP